MRISPPPDAQRQEPVPARPAAAPATLQPGPRPASPSTLEFLAWVARRPRTYAETMEAWQTTCPRHSAWEDAIGGSLVEIASDGNDTWGQAAVTLTPLGRAVLDGQA